MPAPPPTRPALRARYESRRERVVEVAARVFAERGYHATTVQDLTDGTGLAAGGLYHYIGSKEQLLLAVCDALMEPLLARAREVLADTTPADAALRRLVDAWVAHVVEHRFHMRVFVQERQVIEHEPQWRDVRRQRKAFEDLLDRALVAVERERGVPFSDRRLTLLALLGMVNHVPQWYRPRGRLGPAEISAGFCALILDAPAAAGQ
jgi:TetR/AcrR family transcriptional regulator, cholesterol catabolism regulator